MIRGLSPRRLLSVGSILADIRLDVPALPQRGGDVLAGAASVTAGGGFNILAAAARQGLAAAFGGQHGTGPYGDRIRAELEAEGIAPLLAPREAGDSGFCLVLVEPDGERTFITSPGVEAVPSGGAPASLPLHADDALFVSGYDLCYPQLGPAIAAWLKQLPPGVLLTIDPGPLVGQIPSLLLASALGRTDILTLNRREAGLLAGTPEPDEAARAILPLLPRSSLLVIRDGAAGCRLYGAEATGAMVEPIAAPHVTMIDSTGAGDAHTGVLIASLAAGFSPREAAWRANVAAAIAVTRRGPATAPTAAELDGFITAIRHHAVSGA